MSTPIYDTIHDRLTKTFAPQAIEVINESHRHAGHARSDGGTHDGRGETHMRVCMTSAAFSAMSRIERHRAVHDALAEILDGGLHALVLELHAPGE